MSPERDPRSPGAGQRLAARERRDREDLRLRATTTRPSAFVNALAWIANTEDHHPDLRGQLRPLRGALRHPLGRRHLDQRLHLRGQGRRARGLRRLTQHAELDVGLVVAGHGRHYIVETPEGRRLHLPPARQEERLRGRRPRALACRPPGDEGVIEHVEPRRNLLFRQDEWKTKSFAANLDQLLVLVAAEPVFSESQLARALIAAESAGHPARASC